MVKSVRKKPENLSNGEEYFFQHELEKFFPEEEILKINNVWFDSELRIINNNFSSKVLHNLLLFRPTLLQYAKLFLTGRFRFIGKEKIVITDSWSFGYFHWLNDCLPRLLLVLGDADTKQIILPSGLRKFSYIEESLSVLGISNYTFLKEGFLYFIKHLIFPVHLAPTGNYNDKIMRKLRELFRREINEEPSQKIYISRSKSSRRKIINEDEILPALADAGYKTIFCEDLSFTQQVKLFAQAKYVVANHGAGISNILFMKSGTTLLELRAAGDAHNNCYFSLASALDLKYFYQTCTKTNLSEDPHTADIIVAKEQLSYNLMKMQNEE